MQNKKDILLKLDALAEVLKGELSDEAKILYLNCLEEFTDEQITGALSRAVKECKFFPRPAELIEFIEGPKPSAKDNAMVAWNTLIKAIEQHGSYKSVQFEDTNIMSVVQSMGGWQQVCQWEYEDMNWRMKEFVELYSGLSGKKAPDYLPGAFERGNIESGYKPEPPVYIGDGGRKAIGEVQKTDREILAEIARANHC